MHYILAIVVLWISLFTVSFEISILFNRTEDLINASNNCKNEVNSIIAVIGSYFAIVIPLTVITSGELIRKSATKLIYILSITLYIFIRIFIVLPLLDSIATNQTLCYELNSTYILYIIIGEICQVCIIIIAIILYFIITFIYNRIRIKRVEYVQSLPNDTNSLTDTLVYHTYMRK